MTEVKVGDKVLVPVKIIAKDSSNIPYHVNAFNSNSRMWFDEKEMEAAIHLPALPKQIAEKLKEYKREGRLLLSFLNFARNRKWSISEEELALAWLFGYKVDEDKRYRVKLPNGQYLRRLNEEVSFGWNVNETFTKPEMEQAGFGWVWDVDEIEKAEV